MSMINYASREINCKLVYHGPGLGGKTTNLEHIYGKVSPNNLAQYGYDLPKIPLSIQYNKRDLPTAAPIKDLRAAMNPGWPLEEPAQQKVTPDPAHQGELLVEHAGGQWVGRAGYYEAVAIRGDGVFDTLKAVSKMVLKTLS